MDALLAAFATVFDPYVLLIVCLSSAYGLFVGAMPGLTATMATALLVPITFFMPPVPALAAIVTATAMAIFAGDIPGCLLRIPGTPASAAYVDEAYALTRKGKAEQALGAGVVFSAIGGIFGTIVLVTAAPALAEIALQFSSFEYFWLVCLGLTCAVFITTESPLKGIITLFIGLFVATIGINNPAGQPRFTFGSADLLSGVDVIPAMIGLFAIAEVLRVVAAAEVRLPPVAEVKGSVFRGQWGLAKKYRLQVLRGSVSGTLIGALPGAGADIAAWIAYATSKKFSKEPQKFGTGHIEGIVESGAANNAAVSGAWIPALVFGIPGDSITAIVIGVLYLKGLNPGPTIFINNPESIYAVFILFFLSNIIMLPFGWLAIKSAKQILRVPRNILMPLILMFCIVGAFAMNNSLYGVTVMLVFGLLGFFLEENGFPVAPVILGMILGPMLEQNFITSLIKADGDMLAFFERPIAAGLGIVTLLVWATPIVLAVLRRRRRMSPA
jgi:TctA family transporter